MTTQQKALFWSGISAITIGTVHTLAHNAGMEIIGITILLTTITFLIAFWGMNR